MKPATLEMSREQAREEVKKWKIGRTMNDQRITKAFRAIARGEKVIDLYRSFEIAGLDGNRRPLLAVARADSTTLDGRCFTNGGRIEFVSDRWRYHRNDKNLSIALPAGTLPNVAPFEAKARVPIIPPIYRKVDLHKYVILFEAAWQRVTKDPLLLEPLGGALYRVVAAWDLTPVEQVVLAGRPL